MDAEKVDCKIVNGKVTSFNVKKGDYIAGGNMSEKDADILVEKLNNKE